MVELADEFDIRRFSVHNSEENGKAIVIAKADAEEDQIDAFLNAIRDRKPRTSDVSGIRKKAFEGRVPAIVRTSMLSMSTQLAKGIDAIENIKKKLQSREGKIGL